MEQHTDQGLDRPTDPTEPAEGPPTSSSPEKKSWRPADHYAAPPEPRRFPRWVPIAGGVAAIFALVLMFAVGMFLRSGGLGSFVALAIGQFQGELKQMITKEVTPEAKERLDTSLRTVREGLTSGTLDQAAVLPLLQEIQKIGKDRKVTPEELDALQSLADEISPSEPANAPVEF